MGSFEQSKFFRFLIYTLLISAVLFVLFLIRPMLAGVFGFLHAVLAPFVIALIISYVLNPVVNLLSERKMPRTLAVLFIYVVFIGSVVVLFRSITPIFMQQLKELNEHLPQLTMKAQSWFDGIYDSRALPQAVRSGLSQSLVKLESTITQWVSSYVNGIDETLSLLMLSFIVPFLVFYMLKDFKLIEKTVLTFVPKTYRKSTTRLLLDIDKALGNYIRGQFLVCVLVAVITFIGYWFIDMPYPLLLASLVGLFNIIPYLGPFIGAAPALIVASTLSFKMMLFVAIINVVVQVLEGNVIGPQVVGRTLHLHPLMIILALLAGGEAAGIVGLILAVPLLAVLKVILQYMLLYFVNRKTHL